MRSIAILGFTILAASPVSATVNLEYGHEYESAYLEQCSTEYSARSCICSMERLQEEVGFEKFAEQVAQHQSQFFEKSPLRDLSSDLLARCTAVGRVQ
jgi:hypothetical protein